MTRVKVCGMTREADLRAAVDAGVDAVGLIVDVPVETPREIDAKRAAELARATPPFVTSVLVTMPDRPERTVELAARVKPDAIQVHGDVTPEELAYLSANVNGGVIRAVSHATAERYAPVADALLVDSLDDVGAGGTGETHDWARTRELVESLETPVVLAGGLTPANVAEAIREVRPYAVDVATGVEDSQGDARRASERNDGVEIDGATKDHDAIRSFVRNAQVAVESEQESLA